MLVWTQQPFSDLSTHELYALLQLRAQVFVVEQNCAFLDLDDIDTQSDVVHILGKNHQDKLIAYARVQLPADHTLLSVISRVATAACVRGQGLGHALIRQAITLCRSQRPHAAITLSAQTHLQQFYAQYGFVSRGNPYLEDDIKHIQMKYQALES